MRLNRRQVVAGVSTLTLGGGALALSTHESEAISVDAEFDIPDKQYESTAPVSGVRLTVTGEFELTGDTAPEKVVLRLEASTNDEFTQLAAESYPDPERNTVKSFSFDGNLLDLPELSATNMSPTSVGESRSETLTARLTLTATKDGYTIGEKELTDDFSLSIERTAGSVTVSLGATGKVEISES